MNHSISIRGGQWYTNLSMQTLGFRSVCSREKPFRFLTTANGKTTISINTIRA